jgi:O-antigen ligase
MDEPGRSTSARRDAALFVLIALAIVLMPFPLLLAGALSSDGLERVLLLVNDVPLLILAVVTVPGVVRAIRGRTAGPGLVLALALLAAFALSFVFQPSLHGVQVLGRAVGLLGLVAGIVMLPPRFTRPIVVIVCAVAIGQTFLALAQIGTGGPLGLTLLGETQDPLYARGTALAPRGTMTREYSLLLLGLVAGALACGQAMTDRRSWLWSIVAAICAIPLGVTFSRDAVAGIAFGAVGWLVHPMGRLRPAAIALVAFVAAGALAGAVEWQGWADRVDQVVVDRPGDSATDRRALARQAVALIADRPITGVGTGRYEVEVVQREGSGTAVGPDWTPHDVPLWVAAETGLPAAAVVTGLLVVLGLRAWRAGPAARLLFFAIIPFWIFDDLVLTHDQGIVLTGIWLGMIDRYAARDRLR